MTKSRVIYEKEDDVLNIWLSKKPIYHAIDTDGVIVHFTKNDEPVYIEILYASRFLKETVKSLPKKIQNQVWPSLRA